MILTLRYMAFQPDNCLPFSLWQGRRYPECNYKFNLKDMFQL